MPANFDELHTSVSLPLAVLTILLNVAASLIILIVHLLNTLYSGIKSVKASSSRLNNFAYAGCYLATADIVLYTILEAFGANMGSDAKTALCNIVPCGLVIGITLVLGTVLVKTARVYYIFYATFRLTPKYMHERHLYGSRGSSFA